MLEILQKENTEKYNSILQKLNPSSETEKIKIVEAVDRDLVTGFCIFLYKEDTVILYAVECGEDLYLCDGLVRTVLFKASLLGIDRAEFAMTDLSQVRKMGFVEKESRTLSSIQSIMNACENCK